MSYPQIGMIDQVKALAEADERISALLMYGSFIKGEGDKFSDIEFYIFHREDFDHRAWVEQVRPLKMYFVNEFGTEVALFDNFIRGEFHFSSIEEIEVVKSWEGLTSFEHAGNMNLVDKDGRLEKILAGISRIRPVHGDQARIDWLAQSFLNNLILIHNVVKRGDHAHAQQCFQLLLKYLMWLIRLADGADTHWENPSKNFADEISPANYASYVTCVPDLDPDNLARALKASALMAGRLFSALNVSAEIALVLDQFNEWEASSGTMPRLCFVD